MTKTTKSPRKIYDCEFKVHAVELAASKTKAIAQIARELGLSPGTLNKWRKQYREAPINAFLGKGHPSVDDEELKRLRRENDVLKKWVATSRRIYRETLSAHCRASGANSRGATV